MGEGQSARESPEGLLVNRSSLLPTSSLVFSQELRSRDRYYHRSSCEGLHPASVGPAHILSGPVHLSPLWSSGRADPCRLHPGYNAGGDGGGVVVVAAGSAPGVTARNWLSIRPWSAPLAGDLSALLCQEEARKIPHLHPCYWVPALGPLGVRETRRVWESSVPRSDASLGHLSVCVRPNYKHFPFTYRFLVVSFLSARAGRQALRTPCPDSSRLLRNWRPF